MHLTLWISNMHKPILNLPEKKQQIGKVLRSSSVFEVLYGFMTIEDDLNAWSLQVASICRWWDLRSLFLLFTGREVRTVLTVLLYFGPQDSSR